MDYRTIKALKVAGIAPTVDQLDAAIKDQIVVMASYADSLARNAAKVWAAEDHPFPLPTDQNGRVMRRALSTARAQERLCRLYYWREVAVVFATAPAGVGSA